MWGLRGSKSGGGEGCGEGEEGKGLFDTNFAKVQKEKEKKAKKKSQMNKRSGFTKSALQQKRVKAKEGALCPFPIE